MKILFAASECVPFCKTGGLADVIGALPKELRKKRHDVRIILPKYKTIRSQEFGIKETGETIRVPLGDTWETADIRIAKTEKGIKVYFINHEGFFSRAGLYGAAGGDYADNAERFIFFSRGVLEACKAMEFRPDIIHIHDWQTGLIPAYLKTVYKTDSFFQHTKTVLTIHNLAYQGTFHKSIVPIAGFHWGDFKPDRLEYHDQLSFLKAGLAYAERLSTVSPTYAQEIQSSPEFGRGLEGLLRYRSSDLVGILNGLDLEEWDPAKDPFLPKAYDAQTLAARRDCKIHLQKSLKLPVAAEKPLLSMVTRLDWQKGVDLLAGIVPDLMSRQVQLVILGQGDLRLQNSLERYQRQYPDAVRVITDFNDPLAHHLYAGSDLFLMPSRYEPCGLGQMIAMRYGSIPIVAATGGLRDTVWPVNGRDTGTGFLFQPANAKAFLGSILEALHWFSDKGVWAALQRRAMTADFSWENSAQAYLELYRLALGQTTRTRAGIKTL
jgi:starch synthase